MLQRGQLTVFRLTNMVCDAIAGVIVSFLAGGTMLSPECRFLRANIEGFEQGHQEISKTWMGFCMRSMFVIYVLFREWYVPETPDAPQT